jgi:hypothetical protein
MRSKFAAILVAAALAPACGSLGTTETKVAPAPAMSEEAMMKKMEELATPSEGHKRLTPLVGKWKATCTFWMAPEAPPTKSECTSVQSFTLGGRYLRQEFEGDFMGKPFSGIGYVGFNNATHKYEGIWVDSMSTFIMPISIGTCDASGKVFTLSRTCDDPILNVSMQLRDVITIVDNDHNHLETWCKSANDAKEYLMMKIEYTRVP